MCRMRYDNVKQYTTNILCFLYKHFPFCRSVRIVLSEICAVSNKAVSHFSKKRKTSSWDLLAQVKNNTQICGAIKRLHCVF